MDASRIENPVPAQSDLNDFREKGPEPYEPSETLYIDDWPQCIAQAAAVGVPGLVYGLDIKELSELLDLLPEKAPRRED